MMLPALCGRPAPVLERCQPGAVCLLRFTVAYCAAATLTLIGARTRLASSAT